MALGRGLFRLVRLGSTEFPSVRETLEPRHGTFARFLSSPATSEEEKSAGDGVSESAPADTGYAERPRPAWSPDSRRTGAIAVKLGMTQLWDNLGEPVPVTVLQVKRGYPR